jgi:hypothetical protein
MKKLIIVLCTLVLGCKKESNQNMNYRTENIEILGEKYVVKIPKDEIYKDAQYDVVQASKTIYLNLTEDMREKISYDELETLIDFQGNYIQDQQQINPNFTEMDAANIKFLENKLKSINVNLSQDEILEIFDTELIYMKLINIIE